MLDPIPQPDGSILCKQGTYYCRSGTWSACENLRSYVLPLSTALISTGTCNPCNPNCTDSRLTPDPGDLTSSNSSNVAYDPNAPGITLTPVAPPALADSDRDGIPDSIGGVILDECVGPGFRSPCDGTAADDGWFHSLPYGGAAAIDPLAISIKVKTADVYVLMDGTGSMDEEITRLQAALQSGTYDSTCAEGSNGGVLGAIRCTIPDAWFGVGWVREVAWGGSSAGYDDVAFQHLLDVTSSFSLTKSAVNALDTNGNYDWPEAQTEALYAVASGMGFGRWVPNRSTCPNGGFGYACFRPNTIPVVILFTDAPFHQGKHPYNYGYTDASATLPPMSFGTVGNTLRNEDAATAFDFGDLTSAPSTSVMGTTMGMARGGFANATGCTYWDIWGNPQTTSSVGGPDAVYKFSLTATKALTFDTTGSDFDTNLSVWKDNGGGTYTQVACNDDRETAPVDYSNRAVFRTTSYVSQSFAAGTYFVVVDGASAQSGGYRLNVNTGKAASNSATKAFPASFSDAVSALNAHNAKTITVLSCACGPQSIALGQCTASPSTWCATASTACVANCDRAQTACDASCDSCATTCATQKTTCEGSCPTVVATCAGNCATTQSSCNDTCTSSYSTCTSSCTSGVARCKFNRPPYCTGSCQTGWDAQCEAASSTADCKAARDASSCPTASYLPNCQSSWDTMCGWSRGNCAVDCGATQTTCTNTCSTSYASCTGACPATVDACVSACDATWTTCDSGCTSMLTGCYSSCTSARTSCGNTCTSNYNACTASATPCSIEQNAYNACYSSLTNGSDRDSAADCYNAYVDAAALGTQTGSVDSSGAPYVYTINPNGSGLGSTVVSAVQNLANYSRFDVSVTCEDNPSTAFDECSLVSSMAPASGGCPPDRCNGGISGNQCLGCLPGSMVNFSVTFRNDVVMPTTVPQVFDFFIVSYANGSVMERIPVRILVPAVMTQLSSQGTFQIDYDSTMRCTVPPDRPTWGDFAYTVTTPSDSSIDFQFSAADTLAGLETATAVTVTTSASSTTTSPIPLGSVLAPTDVTKLYLRVRAVLHADSTLTQSPSISSWDLQYTCNPAE